MKEVLITLAASSEYLKEMISLLRKNEFKVSHLPGPISEIDLIQYFKDKREIEILICSEDPITSNVLAAAYGSLKAIVQVNHRFMNIPKDIAEKFNISILQIPSILSNTITENVFALLLSLAHKVIPNYKYSKSREFDLNLNIKFSGRNIGIIGKSYAMECITEKAQSLGFNVSTNRNWEKSRRMINQLLQDSDIVILGENSQIDINEDNIELMKDGAVLINCSEKGQVDEEALSDALFNGKLGGYGGNYSPAKDSSLLYTPNCILIGKEEKHKEERYNQEVREQLEKIMQTLKAKEKKAGHTINIERN